MVQQWMNNVGVTCVAPKAEICKRKHYRVTQITMRNLMLVSHVSLNVAGATNSAAIWLKTNPVLALVAATEAGVCN